MQDMGNGISLGQGGYQIPNLESYELVLLNALFVYLKHNRSRINIFVQVCKSQRNYRTTFSNSGLNIKRVL